MIQNEIVFLRRQGREKNTGTLTVAKITCSGDDPSSKQSALIVEYSDLICVNNVVKLITENCSKTARVLTTRVRFHSKNHTNSGKCAELCFKVDQLIMSNHVLKI